MAVGRGDARQSSVNGNHGTQQTPLVGEGFLPPARFSSDLMHQVVAVYLQRSSLFTVVVLV